MLRFIRLSALNRFLAFFLVLSASLSITLVAQDDELAAKLRGHITYLASEQLAGRYPGSEGNKLAADYVAAAFQRNGLRPLSTSYFQDFTIPINVSMAAEGNSVGFEILVPKLGVPTEALKPVKIGWKSGSDYLPLGYSASKSISGEMVFVGFGMTDASRNYDDYAGIDVKGKIVIAITGDPNNYNPHGRFKVDAAVRTRTINAREHGAIGIIFVHPQGDSSEVLMPLHYDSKANEAGIVVLHARRTVVAKIFPKDRPLFTQEEEIVKTKKPRSFDIPNTKVNISVNMKVEETNISNVIGYVQGSDPQHVKEFIVVGAHYDHLGWGDEHSLYDGSEKKIHFGADDNASGTAGMLELAALIAKNPLPRTVVFMAFNAEERGLLGSAYYTKNPLSPLEETICMVNLDMIGRLKDNKLNVHGIGSSSKWKELIDEVNKQYNFTIATGEDGFGPSDHASFYAKDKPVLFLFTGLHADYHRPTDTPDKINYAGESQVVKFVETVLRKIGDMPEKPDFMKVKTTQSQSTTFNVIFGVIPDYSDHPKGLHITGVREGTPAEKAGLKGDDIITKFGTTSVKNIYDLTYALGQSKPGDKVKVTVLRGAREDKEVVLDVTLEGKK